MAITRVRQATGTGTTSPLGVTITGAAAGNLLVVYVASNGSALRTVSSITCTNCTFTKLGSASNGFVGLEIWAAVPTGTSGTAVSITMSGTVASGVVANVTEFSGVVNKTVDATAVANSGTNTAPAIGAYTTAGANDLILVAEAHPTGTGPTVEPTGYANDETVVVNSTTLCIDPDFLAGAAAGSQTATWTIGSAAWCTVVVAVRGAVGALPSVNDTTATTTESVPSNVRTTSLIFDNTSPTTESVTPSARITWPLVNDATNATSESITAVEAWVASVSDSVTDLDTIDSSTQGSFTRQPNLVSENRNDITGSIGYIFQVTTPVSVTALGRAYQGLSTRDHVVNLWISTNTTTPLATATVLASSSADAATMHWTHIAPVILTPGNTYALMSDELSGGDSWPDDWPITSYLSAYLKNGVQEAIGLVSGYPNFFSSLNNMYGEAGMQFNPDVGVVSISEPVVNDATAATTESVALNRTDNIAVSDTTAATTESIAISVQISSSVNDSVIASATIDSSTQGSFILQPPAENRNDVTASLGYVFQITTPVTVTALGRAYQLSSTHDHVVRLWNSVDTVNPLVTATVLAASAPDALAMHWTTITPVVLTPGNTYALMADEASAGDMWPDDWGAGGYFNAYLSSVSEGQGTPAGTYPNYLPGGFNAYSEAGFQFHANIGVISISKPAVSDSTSTTTESVSLQVNTAASVNDATATATEFIQGIAKGVFQVSDASGTTAEFTQASVQVTPSVSDISGATGELIQAATSAVKASVSDTTATTTESVPQAVQVLASAADTSSVTTEFVQEAAQVSPSVSDTTAAATDVPAVTGVSLPSVSDATAATAENVSQTVATASLVFDATGAATESITAQGVDFLAPFDTVSGAENVTGAVQTGVAASDATGSTTESVAAGTSAVLESTAADAVGATESTTFALSAVQAVIADAASVSELVTAAAATETLSVNDGAAITESPAPAVITAKLVFDPVTDLDGSTVTSIDVTSVFDAATGSEFQAFKLGADLFLVSDAPTVAEFIAEAVTPRVSAVDTTATTTESASAVIVAPASSLINVSDATGAASESVSSLIVTGSVVNDGVTTGETVALATGTETAFVSDTAAATDAYTSVLITGAVLSDAASAAENVSAAIPVGTAISDTVAAAEGVGVTSVSIAVATDGAAATDSVSGVLGTGAAVTDSVAGLETCAAVVLTERSVSDAAGVSDVAAFTGVLAVTAFDGVITSEAALEALSVSEVLSDAVSVADFVSLLTSVLKGKPAPAARRMTVFAEQRDFPVAREPWHMVREENRGFAVPQETRDYPVRFEQRIFLKEYRS